MRGLCTIFSKRLEYRLTKPIVQYMNGSQFCQRDRHLGIGAANPSRSMNRLHYRERHLLLRQNPQLQFRPGLANRLRGTLQISLMALEHLSKRCGWRSRTKLIEILIQLGVKYSDKTASIQQKWVLILFTFVKLKTFFQGRGYATWVRWFDAFDINYEGVFNPRSLKDNGGTHIENKVLM